MTPEKEQESVVTIDGSLLAGARAAERMLAQEDVDRMVAEIPENSPLANEAERLRSALGGDLSGLPPGHPFLLALQKAQESYEQRQGREQSDQQHAEVRKAKRLDKTEARRKMEAIAKESERNRKAARTRISEAVHESITGLQSLAEALVETQTEFEGDHMARIRAVRLSRFVQAALRGLSESGFAGA